ncbi:MerR family transcriptional regulator [Nocardia pneumoniae]|uniref:MerR family transcriptional regulator n=1 Tax=Nocardia pneumoniae TaxID=228601 RepID=UPI00031FD0AB|nr:MerR family transcriptional regulator [Nocardia pneumoniae]
MTDNTRNTGVVSIGELSRLTGVPIRTIRFYCDQGILAAQRTSGGHRTFDPATAVDQLLLVRRLRALGVSLTAIVDVLAGTVSVADAVAAERRALDTELAALTWRRASLRAVEEASPAERAARLEVLGAVQDRRRTHDAIVAFWRRVLTPIPPDLLDDFVAMNVPDLPHDPDTHHIAAYAELATLITDPAFHSVISRQLWRSDRTAIRHKRELLTGVAPAYQSAIDRLITHQPPRPGPELDQFVDAHATARGTRDTPRFRRELLNGATDTDPRIHRYWRLTDEVTGTPTLGAAHQWLYESLTQSVDPLPAAPGRTQRR